MKKNLLLILMVVLSSASFLALATEHFVIGTFGFLLFFFTSFIRI